MLKDLITALVDAKSRLKLIDEQYELDAGPLKDAKKTIELEITKILKEREELSARTEAGTATLAIRRTAQITDEQALVHSLALRGLSEYTELRVSDLFKESVLKEQAKELTLDGIEIKETEFLTIRAK